MSPKSKSQEAASQKLECGFCKKEFRTERTLHVHLCTTKQRYLNRDEKQSRDAFRLYARFYEANKIGKKERTFDDFARSTYYASFMKVAKYIADIQAIRPTEFVEFLVKSNLSIKDWTNPKVYETYVREVMKNETPDVAVARNIELMQAWAASTGNDWSDFFRLIAPAQATLWITLGRISPWVLYISISSGELFKRLSPEQVEIISPYIDPKFWEIKLKRHQAEVDLYRSILDEAGV